MNFRNREGRWIVSIMNKRICHKYFTNPSVNASKDVELGLAPKYSNLQSRTSDKCNKLLIILHYVINLFFPVNFKKRHFRIPPI